jgi:hypothetical protein
MTDRAGFPVHYAPGPNGLAAKGLPDSLMAKTDPEHRNLAGEVSDRRDGDPGLFRGAGAGRNQKAAGLFGNNGFYVNLVVAVNLDLFAKTANGLHDIIGK